MFCPKCGASEQTPETYCRQCGVFLPDIDKAASPETPPERHLLINTVLNVFSIVVSVTLAFVLYSMNIRLADSEVLIYLVAGFLIAMAIWQVQTLYRTLQLKKFVKKARPPRESQAAVPMSAADKNRLNPADLTNVVPASVTDRTTRDLKQGVLTSSKTEH